MECFKMQNDNYQSVWTGPKDSDVGFAAKTEENPSIKGGLTSTWTWTVQVQIELSISKVLPLH